MKPSPLALIAILLASSVQAQQFDWSLLEGKWAESTRNAYGCRKDNVHNTFVISEDKKRITFKLDRLWKIGNGKEVREYSAAVVGEGENYLVIKYGDDLSDVSNEMREWEMLFLGPNTYRWRATSWPLAQYNNVVGVKCDK
jgi:hypothetical protein